MASFGVEPTAELRGLARQIRQLYVALLDEGFSDREALLFLGTWAGNVPPSKEPDDRPPS